MRATLPSTFQAQVRSLSVIQSVKCKWFTLIGPSLPRGAFPSLCTDPQATPTIRFFHPFLPSSSAQTITFLFSLSLFGGLSSPPLFVGPHLPLRSLPGPLPTLPGRLFWPFRLLSPVFPSRRVHPPRTRSPMWPAGPCVSSSWPEGTTGWPAHL